MAFDATEALKGGAQSALTALPTGNPKLIAANALIGAATQGFSKPEKFDASPYRNAMRRLRRSIRRRSARDKREAASQNATYLNSKGLDGSGLGAGIAAGNQRMIDQKNNDYLNQLESDLEFQIADTQTGIDRRWDAQKRQNTINLGLTGAGLIKDIYTPDADDPQFLQDLQKKLGLETYPEQQQKQWDQFVEQRKDLVDTDGVGGTTDITQSSPGSTIIKRDQDILDLYPEGSLSRGFHDWRSKGGQTKSVEAGDTASIGQLEKTDTVRTVAEVMPRGTMVSADPQVPGVVHIEPPGSGISFTNTSYIGTLHLQHPLGMMELANHVSGGWEYLLSVLDRPMGDLNNIEVIMG